MIDLTGKWFASTYWYGRPDRKRYWGHDPAEIVGHVGGTVYLVAIEDRIGGEPFTYYEPVDVAKPIPPGFSSDDEVEMTAHIFDSWGDVEEWAAKYDIS